MKLKFFLPLALALTTSQIFAQKWVKPSNTAVVNPKEISRPKLVIGLVVDQMRWDYLYNFYNRYSNGGFKRLINQGFSAENTFINYTPTYTGCGHAAIYTGSVPAINGIIGNNWYDPEIGRDVYCTEDKSVKTVGSATKAGEMSPKNLITTTITDELRIATNFKSKVIGISLKDRGSILPAGHSANAAYWYDGESGGFVTSTYYMPQLPNWLTEYNNTKPANLFYAKNWETIYPIATYTQSTADNKPYEGKIKGEDAPVFPHQLSNFIDKNFDVIRSTPHGNTMTLDLAKLAIAKENLGKNGTTDFLAVSCSSTDYVGHQYGPNSIEIEDTYLRLDKDLEDFFNYLDKTLGKDNYLFFLSADHAVAHVPAFMAENKLPAGTVNNSTLRRGLNTLLAEKFKIKNPVITVMNNQIMFDKDAIDSLNIDFDKVKTAAINYLRKQDGILDAVDLSNLANTTLPSEIKTSITNGYNARRSGSVYFISKPNWFDGGATGTTHGAWYPYDSHIPLLFMGWNVKPGKTNKTYHMTDIAVTLAAMLHIQMPNGSIGQVITEAIN